MHDVIGYLSKCVHTLVAKYIFDADIPAESMHDFDAEVLRDIQLQDFLNSLKKVRKSVPTDSLERYFTWNMQYGDITAWYAATSRIV